MAPLALPCSLLAKGYRQDLGLTSRWSVRRLFGRALPRAQRVAGCSRREVIDGALKGKVCTPLTYGMGESLGRARSGKAVLAPVLAKAGHTPCQEKLQPRARNGDVWNSIRGSSSWAEKKTTRDTSGLGWLGALLTTDALRPLTHPQNSGHASPKRRAIGDPCLHKTGWANHR